ncbi:MAG: TonB-dependent receptor [Pseudomonadota bacterium]
MNQNSDVVNSPLNRSRRNTLALSVCSALTVLCAQPMAFAQERDVALELEEIIVTGQKIDRSLQDTATSVQIYNAELIDTQNFVTIGDILNQTANVSAAFNDAVVTIRGVRNIGASGEVTSDVTAVYVDGVFLPRNTFTAGGLNLWDVQSAEIFRGPQSTVQGRNSLAGAVVMTTKDPSFEWDGQAQVQYGDYGTWRASGAVSVPIIEDELAVRLAFDESRTDGFIDNDTLGTDTSDQRESTNIRAKALWEPSFAPGLSVKLNYTNIDAFRGDGRVDEALFPDDRVTFENIQSRISNEADIASLVVDYELNDVWNLTSVTAYQDSTYTFFGDPTRDETGGPSTNEFQSKDEVFSQELRASFNTERARGLIGAFTFNQTGVTTQMSTSIVGTDFALPDPVTFARLLFETPNPAPEQIGQAAFLRQGIVQIVPEFPVLFERNSDQEIDNWALFGEFDYQISDKWSMTLGLRYDRESIEQSIFDSTIVPPILTGDPLIDQVLALLASQFTNAVEIDDIDNDFDAWLPKAVLTYDWTDNISTSLSYQRGYRAGGLSINAFRGALSPPDAGQAELEALGVVNSFEPEFTNNYELSFRSQFLDGRHTLNANLFYIDYTDQQVSVQLSSNPLDTLTENVGESELYGFEIDYTALLADGFQVGANLGYVSTEFTDGGGVLDDVIGGGLDLTGLEFTYAPEWTAGAFARYEWVNGFYLNGRVRHQGASFSQFDNNPLAENDSFTVFDFIGGYQADSWRIEGFVNNAFDDEYLTASFGPAPNAIAIAGPPRTVGARAVYTF